MSWDLNRVDIIGRLTRDVELKYTPGGTAVAKFSIAVGGKPKADGSDNVSFFEVECWGKTAEAVQKYAGKGKQVVVMGYLKQARWTTQDAQNRSKVIIEAERVQLLGGKSASSEQPAAEGADPAGGGEPAPNDPNF